jgi:hypothetical protein
MREVRSQVSKTADSEDMLAGKDGEEGRGGPEEERKRNSS